MLGTSWTYIDNWHENEMMNFLFLFYLQMNSFAASLYWGKAK